ncbi:hypothetical protein NeNHUV3_19150 [Nereida sp. NH-UV-3]
MARAASIAAYTASDASSHAGTFDKCETAYVPVLVCLSNLSAFDVFWPQLHNVANCRAGLVQQSIPISIGTQIISSSLLAGT